MPQLTRRAWLGIALAAIGLTAAGITMAGAQSDDAPRGTDPLAPDEVAQATDLARGSTDGRESAGLGDDDVVLLVERRQEAKDAPPEQRRADVFVYSYDDDVLTRTVVDLTTGTVVSATPVPDTQLPLVTDEKARAVDLALADPEFARLLATRYRQATGRDLVDARTDVSVQAAVFRADNQPAAVGSPAAACGEHRCAQLLLSSTDGLLVNLLPIVDLSTGRLVSREGFFS